jgi:hypothetical protein
MDEADRFCRTPSFTGEQKMSKQQLAAILEMSAQNPPPAIAGITTVFVMRKCGIT